MSAPVSLAEIRKVIDDPEVLDLRNAIKTWGDLEALVELAEAFLAVRDLDPTYRSDIQAGRDYQAATTRLAMAAQAVSK